MFGGFNIHPVGPGTVIEHEGEKMEVTDGQAVRRGHSIYVTPKTYAALLTASRERLSWGGKPRRNRPEKRRRKTKT